MREVQEEQRMLLDRISGLQLQLSEVTQGLGCLPGTWDSPVVLTGRPVGSGCGVHSFPGNSCSVCHSLPAGNACGLVVPLEL